MVLHFKTNLYDTFLLHSDRRVMKVGKLDSHLVVNGKKVLLPGMQHLLVLSFFSPGQLGTAQRLKNILALAVEAMHCLQKILHLVFDLDRSFSFQNTTSMKCMAQSAEITRKTV